MDSDSKSRENASRADQILNVLKKSQDKTTRGRLKIFLGMVAGVGKTYAMLQGARDLQRNKVDVVVGVCETHGRPETEALLNGLEILPRKSIEYKGARIEEFDIDAALLRKPAVLLVDELAHNNAPGSRHPKRYQDVAEILSHGIDVYTTLNVQHLDSRVDTVKQVTGITVTETVPDSMLEMADEVVLIDIPPERLLERLKAGHVYRGERADRALEGFFTIGNLTALREMALKTTTERVDQDLRNFMTLHRIETPWRTNHRLMVGVFGSPFSERLIRWTRNMSYALGAPWIGVYVETPLKTSEEEKRLLEKNLNLVRQLGGQIVLTSGEDVGEELLRTAQQYHVTQIVAGKSRRAAQKFLATKKSLINYLIQNSGEIDIYVVSGEAQARVPTQRPAEEAFSFPFQPYVQSLGIIAGCGIIFYFGLLPLVGYRAVGVLFLIPVLFISYFFGRGPALASSLLTSAVWDFFFIPPQFTFVISQAEDLMMAISYLAVGLVTGQLTARIKRQKGLLRLREERTAMLYDFSRALSEVESVPDVIETACEKLRQVMGVEIGIILIQNGEKHRYGSVSDDTKEQAVIEWVLTNEKAAGFSTDTLPTSKALYLPMVTPKAGVLGVLCVTGTKVISTDSRTLLDALSDQVEVALEREVLHAQRQELHVIENSEKLYRSLMDSVSHELKTPLTAICGATETLLNQSLKGNQGLSQTLIQQAFESANRLKLVVDNFLDMSRIESGHLQIKKDVIDINDVMSTTLEKMKDHLKDHVVRSHSSQKVLLARGDHVLLGQAISNILHNSSIYTPKGTEVTISTDLEDDRVIILIGDKGPGVPEKNLKKVFDKFYRADPRVPGGTGLGLSITKALVEAHGGTISAFAGVPQGVVFKISLPSIKSNLTGSIS